MQTSRQIAQAWFDAFNLHDIDRLLSLYSEEAVHYSPKLKIRHPETNGYIKGKTALHGWWSDAFSRLPGLQYKPVQLIAEGENIFMEYIRQVPGEEDMQVGEILVIKEGKIIASRVYHS
jgi:ketosteroid isomerase-like protein